MTSLNVVKYTCCNIYRPASFLLCCCGIKHMHGAVQLAPPPISTSSPSSETETLTIQYELPVRPSCQLFK